MDYTPRTLLRHLLATLLLTAIPLRLAEDWRLWLQRNAALLLLLFAGALFVGLLSDRLAESKALTRCLLRWLAGRRGQPRLLRRLHRDRGELRGGWRLAYLWASCSRCLAWWLGGLCGALLGLGFALTWQREQVWIMSLFYGLLASSLASLCAVTAFLLRESRQERANIESK